MPPRGSPFNGHLALGLVPTLHRVAIVDVFPDVSHHPQYGLIRDDHVELAIRPYHDNVKGFRRIAWFPQGHTGDDEAMPPTV